MRKILALWLLVTMPMGLLRFMMHPWLMPRVDLHPGILYSWLMIAGMAWQFVLSVIVLRAEHDEWNWQWLQQRLWLNPPIHPRRRIPWPRAYLYTVPVMLYALAVEDSG